MILFLFFKWFNWLGFKLADKILGATKFFDSSKKLEGICPLAGFIDPLFEKIIEFLFLVYFNNGVLTKGV